MFEKVSMEHPDKLADRIAGAIVDLSYLKKDNPKVAVEVLLGHNYCHIINETDLQLSVKDIEKIVHRIAGDNIIVDYKEYRQDHLLNQNQKSKVKCGDNGIFKGVPLTDDEKKLVKIAKDIYNEFRYDGKYILNDNDLIICQSHAKTEYLQKLYPQAKINPLGYWVGGTDVDTGATNRKLGSDMGNSITGGGLCLSGDSQFLSSDYKWYDIKDWKEGQKVAQWNNGKLEFVYPNKYIHNDKWWLIHIYNQSKLSMCLTPDHEMLIETSKGNLIKKRAKEIADKLQDGKGNSGKIIHNFVYENEKTTSNFPSENYLRLQVSFCADGTIINGKKWKGRIRVKKQYKKERLRELLKGTEYKETIDNDYSIFWVNPTLLNKSLYECFKNEDWNILYDEIYKWDGDEKRKLFRTTKKEDADFIQFVIASFGKVATITKTKNCYNVNELKSTKTGLRKTKSSQYDVKYKQGESYCFNVPSHNLIIRHNDRIFITGNCGKDLSKADVSVNIYAFLKAQETNKEVKLYCAIGDEFVDGKPYSEIVKIARKYILSIGGFEKLAEWGLIR